MTQTHINIAMLAHVDAGKTTLSEALLYKSGSIRKAGRVDNKDAFLDTNEMERNRGITIFSKQAVFSYGGCEFTLLDTRDMWIFPRRWSGHSRYLIMRC